MPDFLPTFRISHDAARRMVDAGIAKATEIGAPVCVAVVDVAGEVIAFVRMDNAKRFSARATLKKAATSASQRMPTGYYDKAGEVSMQIRMDAEFTNVAGGFPVEVKGQVVGGVAAGGARVEQDVEIAKAALAVLQR